MHEFSVNFTIYDVVNLKEIAVINDKDISTFDYIKSSLTFILGVE